ncbi:MAG: Ig-like domain-containing protein, partial [Gammaproteobacteria bacterium]
MDLLKWLAMLPWRLLRGAGRTLAFLLRPLLGEFRWTAPAWTHTVRRHPRASGGMVAGLIVLIVAGWFSWQWYQHRPHPPQMTFEVSAPTVTDYSQEQQKEPVVHPLVVTFSGSAAPIEQVDKVVASGITVSPAVKGEWKWTDDHTLQFMPAADWPVGQHYEVRFDTEEVFAPQVHVAENHFGFETVPFVATLDKGEFYQNPNDASAKQVIQELDFNYPVDPAQLEKRIRLSIADKYGNPGKPVRFTVSYDKQKLHAFIH